MLDLPYLIYWMLIYCQVNGQKMVYPMVIKHVSGLSIGKSPINGSKEGTRRCNCRLAGGLPP